MLKTYGAYPPQHRVFGIGAFFRLKPSMILKIVPSLAGLAKNNLLQISSESRGEKGLNKRDSALRAYIRWDLIDPSLPTEKQRG